MEKDCLCLEPVESSFELLCISQQGFARHLKDDHLGKSRGFPLSTCHECLNYLAEINLLENNISNGR